MELNDEISCDSNTNSTASQRLVGKKLKGGFKILSKIDSGAFGCVYLAVQTSNLSKISLNCANESRKFAVKVETIKKKVGLNIFILVQSLIALF